jgi:hypothetical protein
MYERPTSYTANGQRGLTIGGKAELRFALMKMDT